MKTLDRYVAKTVAVHFASALAVLLAVFSVINLAQELEDIRGEYGLRQALWFVLLTLPNEAYQLFPAAALLGGVLGLGALAAHSELTAMAACGVSRLRLTGAVMYAAAGLMIAAGLLGEFVAAPLAAVAQTQRAARLSGGRTLSTATGLWTRDGSRFVNVRAAHPDGSLGDLYFFDIDADHRMQRFTYARSASYASRKWTLEDLAETTFAEGTAARRQVATQPWDPALSPRQLRVLFIPTDELSVSDLWRAIDSLQARDESAQRHELALWRRLTMPAVTVLMLLLAFPLVPFSARSAPLGQRLVLGALAGIGFQMFSQVFGSFGLYTGFRPSLVRSSPPFWQPGSGCGGCNAPTDFLGMTADLRRGPAPAGPANPLRMIPPDTTLPETADAGEADAVVAGSPVRRSFDPGRPRTGPAPMPERPGPQAVAAAVVGHCPVRLWSLTSEERLRRQLRAVGVTHLLEAGELARFSGSVVLLRADYLFDERTIRDLAAAKTVLVHARTNDASLIAAHVPAERAEAVARHMLDGAPAVDLPGMQLHTPETLSPPYVGKLLKSAQPTALRIAAERQADLERYLFDGSYKGVTDLVTKWLWPHPARLVTRRCAQIGVRPNAVTCVSLLLAVVAGLLFSSGWYGTGLAAGWLMTFLDTVDGKLARVTVDASKFGHIFDHSIDIIHPPLWYWAWGYGLVAYDPSLAGFPLERVIQTILIAYTLGRLAEASFNFLLAKFSIFVWQPVDSYFRLIMSRRNPCLLLLTGSLLLGRPDAGLMAVAVWTVMSCVFLLVRLGQAVRLHVGGGALHPWLAGMRADDPALPWQARPFAPHSAARRRLG